MLIPSRSTSTFAIRGALSVPTLLRWTKATWLTSSPLSMMRGAEACHSSINSWITT